MDPAGKRVDMHKLCHITSRGKEVERGGGGTGRAAEHVFEKNLSTKYFLVASDTPLIYGTKTRSFSLPSKMIRNSFLSLLFAHAILFLFNVFLMFEHRKLFADSSKFYFFTSWVRLYPECFV